MFDVWQRLAEATSFLELATIVCETSTYLELHEICVALHDPDGIPIVAVDNVTGLADDRRSVWVETGDAMLAALRLHRAPVEMLGAAAASDVRLHVLLLPLVDTSAVIGAIRCGSLTSYGPEQRRDLAALAVHVSVRLAQLGITVAEPRLTPRQLEVADLASRGLSNLEVAGVLAISENTVKKQLKDIYRRLDVANRTELAHVLRRPALGPADVPAGVTRTGSITITRRAG